MAYSFLSIRKSRTKSLAAILSVRPRCRKAMFQWRRASTFLAIRWSAQRSSGDWPSRRYVKGRGLGALLLADAVRRAYASASSVGSSMLVVDAIGEQAAAFYEANGFVRPPDSLRLVLPMHAIEKLVASSGKASPEGE